MSSAVDEAMITGESIPVEKNPGDTVIGSTINKSGSFRFRATKVGSDTALAQIIELVENAQTSKAPIQKIADVVAGHFILAVHVIALLAFFFWFFIGFEMFGVAGISGICRGQSIPVLPADLNYSTCHLMPLRSRACNTCRNHGGYR